MVDQVRLTAENRERTGTSAARALRREGFVPAVLYGHGEEPRNLKVEEGDLERLLDEISVDNTLLDLQVDGGQAEKVLIREVQWHPFRPRLLHVDFFHIQEDEEIRVGVPIRYVGTPEGVRDEGGILQTNRNQIEVECLPSEIPGYFEVDVADLGIGDSLHVADLNTGGVRPLEEMDLTLCVVVPPTVITVEEEEVEEVELGELEPELIGEEAEEAEEVEELTAEEAEAALRGDAEVPEEGPDEEGG